MTPENARFLFNFFLPELKSETKITRKVVAAMPEGQGAYRPSEKCMSAMELATHLLTAHCFFLGGVVQGEFSRGEAPQFENTAALLEWFDKTDGELMTRLQALSDEQLAKPVKFYSWELPAVAYLNFMLMHEAHHRGQLSAYLRPMGGKVPSIYGGSADEPMK
jgi:uncharacterized damage-inducible protein DinB